MNAARVQAAARGQEKACSQGLARIGRLLTRHAATAVHQAFSTVMDCLSTGLSRMFVKRRRPPRQGHGANIFPAGLSPGDGSSRLAARAPV